MHISKRKQGLLGAIFAGLLFVAVVPVAAEATQPSVDCDVLESTLIAVDGILPAGTFDNLGDLIQTALADPATFVLLNGLVVAFSGGAISFDDPKEVTPTVSKCRLTPLLVELVSS